VYFVDGLYKFNIHFSDKYQTTEYNGGGGDNDDGNDDNNNNNNNNIINTYVLSIFHTTYSLKSSNVTTNTLKCTG
jgi:hypothetical protein